MLADLPAKCKNAEANARLIAAAPDLLEALRGLISCAKRGKAAKINRKKHWHGALMVQMEEPLKRNRQSRREGRMTTAPKLTAKATRENARRKRQAREALAAYAKVVGQQTEDRETNLLDLLADLMHLMGPETVEGLFAARHHALRSRSKGGRLMTTGNHTHDRPMVNWCAILAGDGRPIH
jgi:hypothetical protein